MPSAPDKGPPAWPTEVRLRKDKAALLVTFDNGEAFEFPAEFLRIHSPSAEVQGHSPDERKTVAGKRNVRVLEVHPVGNYAVRLVFDDLHSTGIFGWATGRTACGATTSTILPPRGCRAIRRSGPSRWSASAPRRARTGLAGGRSGPRS